MVKIESVNIPVDDDPGTQVRKAKGKKSAKTPEQVVRNIL